jgi:hypothetical protein
MISIGNLTYENVLSEIKAVYQKNYNDSSIEIIERVFKDVIALFLGKKSGFQKCDAKYHDLVHTLQVILPFVYIIDGWNTSGETPKISRKFFDVGIISVLLHDTGYIKSDDDTEGTGAKYTFIHVQRSADFAVKYLSRIEFEKDLIPSVRNIIMCTGVSVEYASIHFRSEEERIIGHALGTADLLGQMSAADYLEKLPVLFSEFQEAYRYEGIEKLKQKGTHIFKSPDELMKHTPDFYEMVVMKKFNDMGSLHTYLTYHFGNSKNPYTEAIERNMQKIRHLSLS